MKARTMSAYFKELRKWSKRVQNDIIRLEKFVKKKHPDFKPGKPPKGGDPGDPPHGPW